MKKKIEIELINHTSGAREIRGLNGADGKDGETPSDERLIALIEPRIPKIKQPKDGKSPTKAEIKEIIKEVLPEDKLIEKIVKKVPKGKDGEKGEKGDTIRFADLTAYEKQILTGPPGSTGVGVPRYGTTGQVLAKRSSKDFDTEWVTGGGGGGAVDSVNGQTGVVVLDADDIDETASRIWFTTAEETKLSGIETGAEVNTIDTVSDTSEIDLTITARDLTASIVAGSIDESKLDTSVNASLDLADSAVQDLSDLGITATASEINVLDGITATTTELNYTDGVTSSIQTQIDSKQASLGFTPENSANKGISGGYASLDGSGKVPASQLPAYVDDIIEVANYAALPGTGTTGVLYVTLDTNLVYRWTGSAYVEISPSSGGAWGTITGTLADQTDLQTALDGKVDENASITGATKTKITYDAKGLVTAGADATTADIADSTNKRYVTDAQQTIIAATTASFTTADETKLDGIEAGADVTDATNVGAAGAFMKSVDDADDITVGATNKFATAAEKTKLGHITVTQAVDLDTIESDTTTNNAKVTNATHTGDVTGATALTIANSAVTLAKMADLAQDQFIGRTTASTGVPQTATITAAARTVLDDTTVAAMVDTLGGATSTGTGGIARATSPTFVTPALGTPSALVATNATGTATGLTSGITNALKSATTTVDVSAATAPTSGQVLTATSGTTATWQTPTGGAGWVTIGTGTLASANATLMDVTSISSTYDTFRITICWLNVSGSSRDIWLRFNNDTGSNYATESTFFSSGTVTASRESSQTKIRLNVAQTVATSSTNHYTITVSKPTTGMPASINFDGKINNTSSVVKMFGSADWNNTSAKIDRIKIQDEDGTGIFDTGSFYILEGYVVT